MKIKKNDKIAWMFGGLSALSLIVLMFNTLIGALLIIIFIILFIVFAEPEIKKLKEKLEEDKYENKEQEIFVKRALLEMEKRKNEN